MKTVAKWVYNVKDFGAEGDGVTKDTWAINRAIAECHRQGGGTVLVPSGTYVCGTIEIKSHVTLFLDAGSVILGSVDMSDYPKLPYTSENRNTALITAIGADHIAIAGRGVVDGNGDAFALYEKADLLRDFAAEYTRQRDRYYLENDKADDGPVEVKERPGLLILIMNCREVQVSEVSLHNSPNWCLHVAGTDGALLTGLEIKNSLLIPNSDGIDVSRSQNVRISDCNIEAGDDGLAFSPCAEGYGGSRNENIVVQNCTILSRSAGIRIGWDVLGFRNFLFQNIIIRNSNRGIGLFLREGESIENVVFSNIVIETRLHKGKWWGKAEPIHISALPGFPHSGKTGKVRNVTFRDVTIRSEQGIVLYSTEEGAIEQISFENVRMLMMDSPLSDSFGGNLDLRPALDPRLQVFEKDIPAFYAYNVNNLAIRNFDLDWMEALPEYVKTGIEVERFEGVTIDGFRGKQPQPSDVPGGSAIYLHHGRNVSVRNSEAKPGTGLFLRLEDVADEAFYTGNNLVHAEEDVLPVENGFTCYGNRMKAQ